MNLSYLGTFVVIGLGFGGFYFLDRKRRQIAKGILVNEWLRNDAIVNLLKKSVYSDFCGTHGVLIMNTNHVRLLREYVNNDKQLKRYGVRILKSYYFSNSSTSEEYKQFKRDIENN